VDPLTGWLVFGIGDLNRDGMQDFLWYNSYTGAVAGWMLDRNGVSHGVGFDALAPNDNWFPLIAVDINGDSTIDLLWYHATGDLHAWMLSGAEIIARVSYPNIDPTSGWAILALVDVNFDEHLDMILRNERSGMLLVWLLSDGGYLDYVVLGQVPTDTGWQPIALGDVQGFASLLWYNAFTFDLNLMIIDGNGVRAELPLNSVPTPTFWTAQ
jgi:hypothetical protein